MIIYAGLISMGYKHRAEISVQVKEKTEQVQLQLNHYWQNRSEMAKYQNLNTFGRNASLDDMGVDVALDSFVATDNFNMANANAQGVGLILVVSTTFLETHWRKMHRT